MAWDKIHYNETKKHISWNLNNAPWCFDGNYADWVLGFVPMIESCIEEKDYEGAKGVKDAIIDFVNQYQEKQWTKDVLIRLPNIPAP